MYNALGRAAIRFSVRFLRARYRRQIRIGVGVGALAVGAVVVGYLSARGAPEG